MPWAAALSKATRFRSGIGPWMVAAVFFGASLGIRILLARWLEPLVFLTFYPAIAATTLLCGWVQGVFVLALSALSAWYLFLEPYNSFGLKDEKTVAAILGFLLVGGFIVVLVAAMRELVYRLDRANAKLQKATAVQEDLFRELQHRVANNLQVVASMLGVAKRALKLDQATAEKTLLDAEARIWAMAKLNRRLYDNAALLEGLAPIIEETLADVFSGLPVTVKVDADNVDLSINEITPLILLVTEAATNAAKHVFRAGQGKLFEVSLRRQTHGQYRLVIKDDGPGLETPAQTAAARPSLGMSIMKAFARQLGGTLEIDASPAGTTLSIEFGGKPPQ